MQTETKFYEWNDVVKFLVFRNNKVFENKVLDFVKILLS